MDFKTFYQKLGAPEREAFAEKIGTTTGYCHQIAYGKQIELGLADTIVAASKGEVQLPELPLTARAKFQIEARKWKGPDRRNAARPTDNQEPANG